MSKQPEPTIVVSGTGRVSVPPDVADVRLGVSVSAKTVRTTRAGAARSMTAVLRRLRAAGLADADMQTSGLQLQPTYDYSADGKPPRLTGYTMSNSVVAVVRDLDKLAAVIDGALGAGATSLDGVSFRIADPAPAARQARAAGMADAAAKAEELAAAAGVTIAGVAGISESSPGGGPVPMAKAVFAMARDASTPVEAGENEVVVSVSVAYRIGATRGA
jgi:uncharacterized protein YggE